MVELFAAHVQLALALAVGADIARPEQQVVRPGAVFVVVDRAEAPRGARLHGRERGSPFGDLRGRPAVSAS